MNRHLEDALEFERLVEARDVEGLLAWADGRGKFFLMQNEITIRLRTPGETAEHLRLLGGLPWP